MRDHQDQLLLQLAALASPKRLRMLQLLAAATEPLMTTTIAQLLDQLIPSLSSRHLGTLVSAGLVIRATDGPYALFAMNREAVEDFVKNLHDSIIPPTERTSNESL